MYGYNSGSLQKETNQRSYEGRSMYMFVFVSVSPVSFWKEVFRLIRFSCLDYFDY